MKRSRVRPFGVVQVLKAPSWVKFSGHIFPNTGLKSPAAPAYSFNCEDHRQSRLRPLTAAGPAPESPGFASRNP